MLDARISIPSRVKRFFSPPQNPEQLWGPSSHVFMWYWELKGGYEVA
jgi:hypothetical protein